MLKIIYVLLIVINIGCLIFKANSKIIILFNYIFCGLLFSGSTIYNADYWNYSQMYNGNMMRTEYEILFFKMMDLCSFFGLDYSTFLILVWVVFGTLLMYMYSRFSDNYALFFILYYIYLFFINLVQIRSFCSMAILTMAFYYYIKGNRKKMIICTILASLFHISAMFFLPLCFFDSKKISALKFIKKMAIIVMLLCMLLIVVNGKLNFLNGLMENVFLSLGQVEKAEHYSKASTHFGPLIYIFLHMITIIVTTFVVKKSKKLVGEYGRGFSLEITSFCLIQYWCVFSFPFIILNIHYFRFIYLILPCTFGVWGKILSLYPKKSKRYYLCLMVLLVSQIFWTFPMIEGNSNNQPLIALEYNSYLGID